MNVITSTVTLSGPYGGSIPGAKASDIILPLTLDRALNLGLRNNLGQVSQANSVLQAKGLRAVARSALLPNVSSTLGETLEKINEQGRLRAELDNLRGEKSAPDATPKAEPDASPEPAPEKGGGEEGQEGKEAARKASILARAKRWMAAHPLFTFAIPVFLIAAVLGGCLLWKYLQSYQSQCSQYDNFRSLS